MSYPRCERRGIVFATNEGPRVALGQLFATLAGDEQRAWFCWTGKASSDKLGILPDGVERFLNSIEIRRQLRLFA